MTEKEKKEYYDKFNGCFSPTLQLEKSNLLDKISKGVEDIDSVEKLSIIEQIEKERSHE